MLGQNYQTRSTVISSNLARSFLAGLHPGKRPLRNVDDFRRPKRRSAPAPLVVRAATRPGCRVAASLPDSTVVDADSQIADTSRIETFSDGVFAIAITLLVLELQPPHLTEGESLWSGLLDEWPQFGAYLTSFAILGIMWVNHHSLFRLIQRSDRPLMFLNLNLLLWTALLPFPTVLLAEYLLDDTIDAHIAAAVYSTNLTLAAIAFSAIWWHVLRVSLVKHDMTPAQQRTSLLRFSLGTVFYAATIGLSFVSAPLTLLVQFLLAVYYGFEQLRTRATAA